MTLHLQLWFVNPTAHRNFDRDGTLLNWGGGEFVQSDLDAAQTYIDSIPSSCIEFDAPETATVDEPFEVTVRYWLPYPDRLLVLVNGAEEEVVLRPYDNRSYTPREAVLDVTATSAGVLTIEAPTNEEGNYQGWPSGAAVDIEVTT